MGTIEASFRAKDRSHAKRLALRYFFAHRKQLGLSLPEFTRRCVALGDGATILFLSEGN